MKQPSVLTPEQVAKRLQLAPAAVIKGRLRRLIPWFKLAGRLRVTEAGFEQFLMRATGWGDS